MREFRWIDQSVRRKVSSIFTTPGQGLTAAWNVYHEDNFASSEFVPTAPYIFLLESKARPRQSRLPMLIIERAPIVYAPYEIGTRDGFVVSYSLHVYARNRGERSDLAAVLFYNLDSLGIYDFSTNPETLLYTVSVEEKFSVSNTVAEDVGMEGALSNWESIGFTLEIRNLSGV